MFKYIEKPWYIPEIFKDSFVKMGDTKTSIIIFPTGRGTGKTYNVTGYIVARRLTNPKYKNSLILRCTEKEAKNLTLQTLKNFIDKHGLDDNYTTNRETCIHKITKKRVDIMGTENKPEQKLRGFDSYDFIFIDEAQYLSKEAWDTLISTFFRGSEMVGSSLVHKTRKIVIAMNPTDEDHFLYRKYVIEAEHQKNAFMQYMTWEQNPFLKDNEQWLEVIEESKKDGTYEHLYLGKPLKTGSLYVFRNKMKVIPDSEIDEDLFFKKEVFYGFDFGYTHPFVCIRVVVAINEETKRNNLYITHEAVATHLENDDIFEFCESRMPKDIKRAKITADSSRPELISYLKKKNDIRIIPSKKGKNSVMEGIKGILSFESIFIAESCQFTIKEFRNCKHKMDLSGNIIDKLPDEDNHSIDACRYAVEDFLYKKRENYEERLQKLYAMNS